MHVGYTDSQLELAAAVREVLTREASPAAIRTALADDDGWRELWRRVVELGWPALALQDEDSGLGLVELVAVLETCGGSLAPLPLLSSAGFAAGALAAAGATGAVEELAGGAVGALGATAVGGRRLTAPLQWDGARLSGTVGPVAHALQADLLVLLASRPDGSTVAAVVRPGPGVELRPRSATDPSRPLADVQVDVVPESVHAVALPAALTVPLTAAAADLVGVTGALLDLAVAHARGRDQFGHPIGAFQGVKHRLADCYVGLERARSLTYAAAMEVADPDAHPLRRWRSALLAKAAAGEAAVETARAAVQVHGAIAMTWEHDAHLYLRRAWQSAALLGESRALYAEAATMLVEAG